MWKSVGLLTSGKVPLEKTLFAKNESVAESHLR